MPAPANERPQISSARQDQIIAVEVVLLISFLVPKLIVQFNRHLLFFMNMFELRKLSDFFPPSRQSKTRKIMHPVFCPVPLRGRLKSQTGRLNWRRRHKEP